MCSTFVLYFLITFFQPPGSSDVILGRFVGLAAPDKFIKFPDPCLNGSPEIRPEAVGGGIFDRFTNFYKCRPEVAGDVISGRAID